MEFSASVMCLKMDNLAKSVKDLDNSGIDRLHLDFMDGVFVPNYALGLQDVEAFCRLSKKEAELHLMTVSPGRYIKKFAELGVRIIYIHPEADYHPSTVLQEIISAGVSPGVVLSPGTSVDSVIDLLGVAEYVMVMTVNPGHAAQPFLPYVGDKIQKLLGFKKERGFKLGIDGAVSSELIKQYSVLGVDCFVLGTKALFHQPGSYAEIVTKLRGISGGDDNLNKRRHKVIRFFVTDVDGTLTDGKIHIGETGEAMKAFDIKDGYALHELLPNNGIVPVIVTGRNSVIVNNRAKELEIEHVFQGVKDKLAFVARFAEDNGVTMEEVAYIGDDISDIECIKACGIGACPADAAIDVRKSANIVTRSIGGSSAVREFAEYIVRSQSSHDM